MKPNSPPNLNRSPSSNLKMKRNGTKLKNIFYSQKVAPYVFVLPFLLIFTGFYLYPVVSTFIMSFQQVLPGQTEFIGLRNYERLFNPTFFRALYNTTLYTFWTIVILIPLPLLLAIILNSKVTKYKTFFRACIFIPALTSTIVAGVIFRLLFAESESAFGNSFIMFFGFDPVAWRQNAGTLMFLMVGLAAWRWMGVNMIYFLTGLQNIPKEMYEAAEIDGANTFNKFRHITLPFLKPVTVYVLTITLFAGYKMFEEAYVFWEVNSPGNIGLTLVGYLYKEGFQYNQLGFGSAVGVTLLIIVAILGLIQLRLTGVFGGKGDN
ncbi:arabinosaccharide transport system permease protein [Evansella vedderi]|uniref:Arabinosaccharide transport system permease protein n=1 Tax=Evansella vedderi TaxID=38282 RepID=A0ABT9ZPY4_9BACI|nr:sugar ABC transporter permease [Evansella vedderi]MDQ0253264.1 arabinosaccharide transport system permease protein [Evansella vedderi]